MEGCLPKMCFCSGPRSKSTEGAAHKTQDCQPLHTTAGLQPPAPEELHPTSVTKAQGAGRLLREISSPGEPRAQLRESPPHPHNSRAAPQRHQHFTDSTHLHRPIFSALHLNFSTRQTERERTLFHVSSHKPQVFVMLMRPLKHLFYLLLLYEHRWPWKT